MVRTVTLAVAIAALCSPLINASPLIEPTAALGSNDDLPAPSAVPQTPPTPESPPRTVDGGVLTCHASYISGDNPHFYMDRDEAVSTAQDFCSRIQPGVVFKQGGTPLQTAQDDGPYGYPMTISAIWRPFPPDRKDCPVLDFNYFNATSICQQSLVDNIIDRCKQYSLSTLYQY